MRSYLYKIQRLSVHKLRTPEPLFRLSFFFYIDKISGSDFSRRLISVREGNFFPTYLSSTRLKETRIECKFGNLTKTNKKSTSIFRLIFAFRGFQTTLKKWMPPRPPPFVVCTTASTSVRHLVSGTVDEMSWPSKLRNMSVCQRRTTQNIYTA